MKAKKTLSEQQFFNLSKSQQEKELKKMTKRANVRLSLLEEKNSINLAYRQAYQYNMSKDKDNNRFYEGTRYKTSNDIKEAYNAVTSFLENRSSTLKGMEQGVKDVVQPMLDKIFVKDGNYIDYNTINKMNAQEKRYASKLIAQASNKKLSDLEKNDIKQYAYQLAQHYNEKVQGKDKNRFYRGINFKDDKQLQNQLEEMIHFYNAKTSTVEGYQSTIQNRLDAFREKGVIIPKDREKEFFDFMGSDEYKSYTKNLDSNQVAETFNEARDLGKSVDEINKKFQLYTDGITKTFDQVQEQLGITPWLDEQPKKFKFKQRKK